MPFTDDDLKRLKEQIDFENYDIFPADTAELQALLARLEAAEAYCEEMGRPSANCLQEHNIWMAWRKAAGK